SADGLRHLVRLQVSAIVLGAVFLALGNCLSASVRQAGTAASLAIAVWIIAVVMFDVALLGAVVADDSGTFTKVVFPWLLVISPTDAFRLFNLVAVEAGALNGAGGGLAGATQVMPLPDLAPVISLLAWPFALLALAGTVLRRFEP
ncbi:MAG TPA: ABC transporter permease subunit, partial [Afifellaceae bacterium]|nr:ABC transporter permease subunit [Afifellaceae bacterium]